MGEEMSYYYYPNAIDEHDCNDLIKEVNINSFTNINQITSFANAQPIYTEFNNTEEWYQSIPQQIRPRKDHPFYHVFAENDDVFYTAYVSQQNLVDDGAAAIQAITIDDSIYERYKNKTDFIQKYIFPGGFLPSKNELISLSNQAGLKFEQCSSYGDHYSNTLSIWRDEFFNKWDQISSQGFDNTFKRMWNFYLSYCEAGFKSKNIDLIQFALQK